MKSLMKVLPFVFAVACIADPVYSDSETHQVWLKELELDLKDYSDMVMGGQGDPEAAAAVVIESLWHGEQMADEMGNTAYRIAILMLIQELQTTDHQVMTMKPFWEKLNAMLVEVEKIE